VRLLTALPAVLATATAVVSCGLLAEPDPGTVIARCLRVPPDAVTVKVSDDGLWEEVLVVAGRQGRQLRPEEVENCIDEAGLPTSPR
jgi:hypothetical protein